MKPKGERILNTCSEKILSEIMLTVYMNVHILKWTLAYIIPSQIHVPFSSPGIPMLIIAEDWGVTKIAL